MKTIKVLGTGCSNCKRTEEILKSVIKQLNLNIEIEKVEDIQEIMRYNVMSTPAIVIDEIVVLKGRVPSLSEAKELLENASASSCCSGDDNGSCCNSEKSELEHSCCASDSASDSSCC